MCVTITRGADGPWMSETTVSCAGGAITFAAYEQVQLRVSQSPVASVLLNELMPDLHVTPDRRCRPVAVCV